MDEALRDKIDELMEKQFHQIRDLLEERFSQLHADQKWLRDHIEQIRPLGFEVRLTNTNLEALKLEHQQIYNEIHGEHGIKSRMRHLEEVAAEQRPMNRGVIAVAMAMLTAIGAAIAGFIVARLNP